jgi:hypothetical protein
MINKEFILCAAIWWNDDQKHQGQPKNIDLGFVICGRRHSNCYAILSTLVGLDESIKEKVMAIENKMRPDDYRKSQGFITSLDRYVDRKEAWLIAKAANQIQFGLSSANDKDNELISENLY